MAFRPHWRRPGEEHEFAFGWEDEARAQAILHDGDWRRDFGGAQYYFEEDEEEAACRPQRTGRYHDVSQRGRRGRRSAHGRRSNPLRYRDSGIYDSVDDGDDLHAYEGHNRYDNGWSDCEIQEDIVEECAASCQTRLPPGTELSHRLKVERPPAVPPEALPSTHVLQVSKCPAAASGSALLHWKQTTGTAARVHELLSFMRDTLLKPASLRGSTLSSINSNYNYDHHNADRELAMALRRRDRQCRGLLERNIFEDVLDAAGLLANLRQSELDEIADAFAEETGDRVYYRRFLRALLSPKKRRQRLRRRRGQRREEDAIAGKQDNDGGKEGTAGGERWEGGGGGGGETGTTLISGSWRGEPFHARVTVSCNRHAALGGAGGDVVYWPRGR